MIEGQEGVTWEQWVTLARACEELGFGGLFRSDHYLSFSHPTERGALDAWATVTALGAVTERIRLGTMVSPVTFRHPATLAKSVVTADHVSGGRVELGMGAGWFEREHTAFGFPFPPVGQRMDMLAEQVEIVHRLWGADGGEVTFEGRHYRLDACPALPRSVQEPHPWLIVGGGAGPRSAAIAARWADEYDVVYVDPAGAKDRMDRISAACEAIGRDPSSLRRSLLTKAIVGTDESEVRRRAAALMSWTNETGDVGAFLEELRTRHLAGTVAHVLDRLAQYAAAGIQRVLVHQLVHEDLDSVALIGDEVVPAAAVL
ncbi:MAG: TIGR03560 family F420-dependent LLM class oxidoreductase [Candidatus Velamenicoccus archaeovorus]